MTGDDSGQPIDDSAEREYGSTEARLVGLAGMGNQADALVREHPELLTDVVRGLAEIDVAAFVSANPAAADRLQELLWTSLSEAVEEDNPRRRFDGGHRYLRRRRLLACRDSLNRW